MPKCAAPSALSRSSTERPKYTGLLRDYRAVYSDRGDGLYDGRSSNHSSQLDLQGQSFSMKPANDSCIPDFHISLTLSSIGFESLNAIAPVSLSLNASISPSSGERSTIVMC